MRTPLIVFLTLILFGLFFTSCSVQPETPAELVATEVEADFRSSDIDLSHQRYILMAPDLEKSIDKVRKKLAALGVEESGYLPQVGMLFVASDDPGFELQLKGLGLTIIPDLIVERPNVNPVKQAFLSGLPSSTDGMTNPFFPYLWGLDAIDAPEAWQTGHTGKGVVVAVLDEGFYLGHPDIGPNIDQSLNRNFVNLNDLGSPFCDFYDECDPGDVSFKLPPGFSHATHVAGTVAALDNDLGVVGVAPDSKIMAVKVLSDYAGFGLVSWIVQGIVYAADQEADVINLSLGGMRIKGSGKGSNLIQEGIKAYNAAIQYATQKGTTVIAAIGNDGIDLDHSGSVEFYPAASSQALAISATAPEGWFYDQSTDLDVPTSYTNYGSSRVHFSAPGGDFDFQAAEFYFDMVLSTSGPSDYYFSAGTSMAAPHVAGVAALLIGKNGGSMDPAKVKAALRKSADDLGKPGKDPFFGLGRVNAFKAVQ